MAASAQQPALRGELRYDEPMSRHTSWRVGGPARRFYRPADLDDLALFLSGLPEDEPLLWLGLGSNLLVRDGGFNGTVIATCGVLNRIEFVDGRTLRAEAGVTCAKAARFSVHRSLTGIEFLASIPGTIGGALAMNAGAFGGETWEWVQCVEVMNRRGERRMRRPGEYRIGYRSVQGPEGEWFVAAHLRLEAGDGKAAMARIKGLLDQRARTQPIGEASCGSVFRNPPGDHAARLIEAAGLKGRRLGGAVVSEKHANFIINPGAATASDIEALICEVAATVERVHGVRLQPEVVMVGEGL